MAQEINFFSGNSTPGGGNNALYQSNVLDISRRDLTTWTDAAVSGTSTVVYSNGNRTATITATSASTRRYLSSSTPTLASGKFYVVSVKTSGIVGTSTRHNMYATGAPAVGEDRVIFTSDGWWYFAFEGEDAPVEVRIGVGVLTGDNSGVSVAFDAPMIAEVSSLGTAPLDLTPPGSTAGYGFTNGNTLNTEQDPNAGSITQALGSTLTFPSYISAACTADSFGNPGSGEIFTQAANNIDGATFGVNAVSGRTLVDAALVFDDVCKYTDIEPSIIKPQFAMIEGGVNDFSGGASAATVSAARDSCIATAQSNGLTQIILFTVAPSSSLTASQNTERHSYNVETRALAASSGFGLVDFAASASEGGLASDGDPDVMEPTYTGDGTHPNTESGKTATGLQIAEQIALIPIGGVAPILTTPYSIGTNGGPLFAIGTDQTIATIESANYFDGRADYASTLSTGDVIMVQASDATKFYTVTVNKEARTIALSTGTAIS